MSQEWTLKSIKQKLEQHQENKEILSSECCNTANMCLEYARNENFQDKEILKKAAFYFSESIRLNTYNIDAYLGIAYLLSLTNEYNKALNILMQADSLKPNDIRIKILINEIQNTMKNISIDKNNNVNSERRENLSSTRKNTNKLKSNNVQKSANFDPVEGFKIKFDKY